MKLRLDLHSDVHKKFVEDVWEKHIIGKFPDIDSIEISLNQNVNDESNKIIRDFIKYWFPANIDTFTLKNLAGKPFLLESYDHALNLSKARVINEFCVQNFKIKGTSFGTYLATNFETQKIKFYACTFSKLDEIEIDSKPPYWIEELSFCYCKGLNNPDYNIKTIICEIGKNKYLSDNLKTIELHHNCHESKEDITGALDDAGLKINLVFTKSQKKNLKVRKEVKNNKKKTYIHQYNKHQYDEHEEEREEGYDDDSFSDESEEDEDSDDSDKSY